MYVNGRRHKKRCRRQPAVVSGQLLRTRLLSPDTCNLSFFLCAGGAGVQTRQNPSNGVKSGLLRGVGEISYWRFLMMVIELPDEQAAALKAKAAAEGLSLEAWLQKLAEQERPASRPHRHIADVILENMQDVPPEIMATMPEDGASQHDHYIYGWPKKEA